MHGAEALLRWTHPVHGPIPPAKFIPIAEECGLIGAIGAWVVREACRQARAWQLEGLPPLRVAVNSIRFAVPAGRYRRDHSRCAGCRRP